MPCPDYSRCAFCQSGLRRARFCLVCRIRAIFQVSDASVPSARMWALVVLSKSAICEFSEILAAFVGKAQLLVYDRDCSATGL